MLVKVTVLHRCKLQYTVASSVNIIFGSCITNRNTRLQTSSTWTTDVRRRAAGLSQQQQQHSIW